MAVERAEPILIPEPAREVPAPQSPTPVTQEHPQPRLFDVDEYYRMAEAGILRPDERVELIEGEIYLMSPIGDRHALTVDRLLVSLVQLLAGRARFSSQNPIRLARKVEPQPDITLSRLDSERPRQFQGKHPRPADIYLLIEVADSSLAYDLGEKADLYARYGVRELWVLDLTQDRLLIHREPTADGYASVVELPHGESVSPIAFPDIRFTADEVLGAPLREGASTDDLHEDAAGDQ